MIPSAEETGAGPPPSLPGVPAPLIRISYRWTAFPSRTSGKRHVLEAKMVWSPKYSSQGARRQSGGPAHSLYRSAHVFKIPCPGTIPGVARGHAWLPGLGLEHCGLAPRSRGRYAAGAGRGLGCCPLAHHQEVQIWSQENPMCPLEKLMTRKANLGFQRVPTAQPGPHETAALPPGGKSTHSTHTRPHAAGHAGRSLHQASCPQRGAHSQAAASRRGLPLCSRPWPGRRDRQAGGVGRSSGPLPPGPPRRAWPSRKASCQRALQVTELVCLGPRKTVAPAVLSRPK